MSAELQQSNNDSLTLTFVMLCYFKTPLFSSQPICCICFITRGCSVLQHCLGQHPEVCKSQASQPTDLKQNADVGECIRSKESRGRTTQHVIQPDFDGEEHPAIGVCTAFCMFLFRLHLCDVHVAFYSGVCVSMCLPCTVCMHMSQLV